MHRLWSLLGVAEASGWHSTHTSTASRSRSAPPCHAALGFSDKTSIFRHTAPFKRKIETSHRKHYSRHKLFEESSFF